jgi:hypothetical protein
MENEIIFLFMYVCHYRPRPGTLLFDFVAMCDCVQVNASNLEFQLNFESIPPPRIKKKLERRWSDHETWHMQYKQFIILDFCACYIHVFLTSFWFSGIKWLSFIVFHCEVYKYTLKDGCVSLLKIFLLGETYWHYILGIHNILQHTEHHFYIYNFMSCHDAF